ncbi:hypothetical protein Vafri_15351 [Volvox africanus]|uniref:Uncharacterized protein n=1 Tax=Volvox africanus TaxID=51714 RepID=A0A8J4BHI9_9CHLO|nr:hypothetical protein Vafri_15351 [Volvox africanus]
MPRVPVALSGWPLVIYRRRHCGSQGSGGGNAPAVVTDAKARERLLQFPYSGSHQEFKSSNMKRGSRDGFAANVLEWQPLASSDAPSRVWMGEAVTSGVSNMVMEEEPEHLLLPMCPWSPASPSAVAMASSGNPINALGIMPANGALQPSTIDVQGVTNWAKVHQNGNEPLMALETTSKRRRIDMDTTNSPEQLPAISGTGSCNIATADVRMSSANHIESSCSSEEQPVQQISSNCSIVTRTPSRDVFDLFSDLDFTDIVDEELTYF